MLNLKTVLMALSVLFSVAFPVALLLVWRKKTGAKLLPFFVGMAVFFLFAMVLESLFNYFILQKAGAVSRFLKGSDAAYVIYAAVIAGIFEETGRFLAFKTVLRRRTEKCTAVTYGIGHGGIEAILVLGVTYVLLLAALLTKGQGALGRYLPDAQGLTNSGILIAVAERVLSMAAHIGLSVFVFFAVWDAQRLWYYPLAIWLHALVDAPVALWQRELLPLWQAELISGVFAVITLFLAIRVYKKYRDVQVTD